MPQNFKSALCLLVYNRVYNLHRWLEAWQHCQHFETQLYIIHTRSRLRTENKIKTLASQYRQPVIVVDNLGMDIGAMKRVFTDTLPTPLLDWRYLVWCVDDCIPMKQTFLYTLLVGIGMRHIGLAGIHYSDEYKPHIRTNMFAIKREVAEKIKFPMETKYTRTLCYEFEHRGNSQIQSLSEQVIALGYQYQQVAPLHTIGWDIGHYNHMNLWETFFHEFPSCRALGTRN